MIHDGVFVQRFINDHVIKQDDIGHIVLYGLLIIGFICNELIKPVDAKFHEPSEDLASARRAE